VLLGPATGCLVVSTVILLQALVFADGGLTAIGYNTLNMAVVASFGGYALFLLFRWLLPRSASGVVMAGGLAGGLSVVLAAVTFSLEWLFGATAPVPFDTVFGSMVGVHALIGIAEGAITATTLSAVLAVRPDLVFGAADLPPSALVERGRWTARGSLWAAVITVAVVAAVISQFASSSPDGLARVADNQGIEASSDAPTTTGSIFADYATRGIDNEQLSLAVAGLAGAMLAGAVGTGLLLSSRAGRESASPGSVAA